MKIYLASGSPRRRELLTQIGIEYEVLVSEADEECDIKDPALLVEELSKRKAEAVFDSLEGKEETDYLVIGADTVVAIDGQILGKPSDKKDAEKMIRELSGRAHEVYTGVTLCYLKNGSRNEKTFHEMTKVIFCPMSEDEIHEYAESGEPLDKAGAYGIQGLCAKYIKGIDGDYNNVVGLPIGRLYREMRKMMLL